MPRAGFAEANGGRAPALLREPTAGGGAGVPSASYATAVLLYGWTMGMTAWDRDPGEHTGVDPALVCVCGAEDRNGIDVDGRLSGTAKHQMKEWILCELLNVRWRT